MVPSPNKHEKVYSTPNIPFYYTILLEEQIPGNILFPLLENSKTAKALTTRERKICQEKSQQLSMHPDSALRMAR